ncbi:NCS2 family permease [Ralstonia solanacearum]|uniref:NCS2 family permease n=2 Tax=Ralstonia solanacearum species complex TaxID=3116862 RepID=UPI002E1AA564
MVAGLTMFLTMVRGAGLVVGNPATLVALGDVHQPSLILAVTGFFVIVTLDHLRVKGAILIGILTVTVTAASGFLAGNTFHGVVSMPPSIAPTLLPLDIQGGAVGRYPECGAGVFLVERFDATGTLMVVANRAGLLKAGRMDRLNKALPADSTAIVAGSMLGTSSTTASIESAAGVQAGGRTGLAALTVAVLFLACQFIAPLAGVLPAYATAPALLYVSCLMLRGLVDLDWADTTESVPAALLMLFTDSIANGVAFGFIIYSGLTLFGERWREVPTIVWIISLIFLFRFFYLPAGH